jgi:O-antigen/teichoic acid export membrane protein
MVLASGEYDELVLPLALTALVVFIVSPVQDHVRRVLHLDRSAWQAATVSIVQAVVALVAVAALHLTLGDPAWVAFGGLAIANVVSTVWGLAAARRSTRHDVGDPEVTAAFFRSISITQLFRMGRWLGTAGALSTGANLLVAGVVSALAGEAALGYAEAARTLAQPIVVVSMALRSVYGPDSMRTARSRDKAGAAKVANTFMLVLWPLTVVYALAVGWDWSFSPLGDLVPTAYVVAGLVVVSVIGNGFNGASFPLRLELVGADRERALFVTDTLSNVMMVVVSVLFAYLGAESLALAAMARPAGMVALGLCRWLSFRFAMVSHYRQPAVAA